MAQVTKPQNLENELEEKLSSIQVEKKENEAAELGQKLNLPHVDLSSFPIDTSAILLVSENDARSGQLAVIAKSGKNIKVAVISPENPQTQSVLSRLKSLGYAYGLIIVSSRSLEFA